MSDHVSLGEITSKATSGGKGAGPQGTPPAKRLRRTRLQSGQRKFSDAILKPTSVGTLTHAGLAVTNFSAATLISWITRPWPKPLGDINFTSPSTYSQRCPSFPAARNSAHVNPVFVAILPPAHQLAILGLAILDSF